MPSLLLGPLLRHVDADGATVWVETNCPCEVSIAGSRARTWEIEGHHFALVEIGDLEPDEAIPYEVELDGRSVWPPPEYEFPAPTIRPLGSRKEVRLIFGSCRVSLPNEPPYVLHQSEHPDAQGIDALRTLALRIMRSEERAPDCLLMLGDQIYADDLSPAMKELAAARGDDSTPAEELADFGEYALAYREAWSEPVIRWLLSTVPTAMIFDDHEIHAQWKISRRWQRMLESQDWYERKIIGGLVAYWVFQHIGNLSPRELARSELLQRVRNADADASPILREQMRHADRQPGHSRWSFYRDLGDSRLLVIDSRAGRELDPPERKMISAGEWEWIVEHAAGDFDHLLLASSVPFFLTPGLHHIEAWDAQLADRGRTALTRRLGEKIREVAVMDHWASFPSSFAELCELLAEIGSGRHGEGSAPATITMLSGDVHHCYLADIALADDAVTSCVWQAVCSAYRKDLAPKEKRAMRAGNSRAGELVARGLARLAGAGRAPASWQIVHDPTYDNQVASLELSPERARITVETAAGSDWRRPELRTVFEEDLLARVAPRTETAGEPRSPG